VNYRYVDYIKNSRKDIGSDASELVRTKEIQEIIDKTLNELPERTSKIFKLNRFEGLKYKEIAEQLSVSIKTVEANMGKALKLFRNNLKEYVEAS
ncbi:MAG: sigma-70 family RNA polymerase sigma factor, partial [Bacteroidales bacterium]|nr:sigma-70 family RNA polymerase sigma factor [Bacteroidales bacterium]